MNDTETISLKNNNSNIFDFIKVLFQALILTIIVRSFLVQPFVIPSGSMRPTLLVGDYIFVTKWSYGYSRYSLPLAIPFFKGRIFASQPQRGDVVVFNHLDYYSNSRKDFIKRLVGLPGDHIQMRNGTLYINNKAIERQLLGKINDYDITGEYRPVDCYKEKMENGVEYNTLNIDNHMRSNNTEEFVVPEHHYFMMGDNRDNSEDSRFSLGYIKDDELLGRASNIFFSLKNSVHGFQIWRWFGNIRSERIGNKVNILRYKQPIDICADDNIKS